jgi:hypothetical protein
MSIDEKLNNLTNSPKVNESDPINKIVSLFPSINSVLYKYNSDAEKDEYIESLQLDLDSKKNELAKLFVTRLDAIYTFDKQSTDEAKELYPNEYNVAFNKIGSNEDIEKAREFLSNYLQTKRASREFQELIERYENIKLELENKIKLIEDELNQNSNLNQISSENTTEELKL